jgi:hypothetical protein
MKVHKNYIILFVIFLLIANFLILIKRNNTNFTFPSFHISIEATTPITREYLNLSNTDKKKVLKASYIIKDEKNTEIFYELYNFTPVERAIVAFNSYPGKTIHFSEEKIVTKKVIVPIDHAYFKKYGSNNYKYPGCAKDSTNTNNITDGQIREQFRLEPNMVVLQVYLCG